MQFGKYVCKKVNNRLHEAYRITFSNGYGASIVRGAYTYGGDKGLWELAVLDKEGRLCYDTPITDDVLGYLTEKDVADTLKQIESLSK